MQRVFVYGIFKTRPHFDDPPDSVRGAMYVADGYAACIFGGEHWVRGEVREIDAPTLERWDEIEDVDGGLYRRVPVVTCAGVEAWAYEYARPVVGLPLIESGVWCPRRPRPIQ